MEEVAVIDSRSLWTDLRRYVRMLGDDLHARLAGGAVDDSAMRSEYERARRIGRTGAGWTDWRDERITQAAVAWVLGTVFVRFAEDNGLLDAPRLVGRSLESRDAIVQQQARYLGTDPTLTDADWLLSIFDAIARMPVARSLFDPRHNPLYQLRVSHDAAKALIEFWRQRDEHGRLVHDFADPDLDTSFLADLYQDLSESARKSYALVRTPGFVADFILEHTLDPAIEHFGHDQIRMIDPVCGSGEFVLGAFERLMNRWMTYAPELDPRQRVRRVLPAVHGVDLNPFAATITRFRLLVAALRACGTPRLDAVSDCDWEFNIAVGDSLLATHQARVLDEVTPGDFAYTTEDIQQHADLPIHGYYHVVVGNPPYLTVKDRALDEAYRKRYDACTGTYSLTVPFTQRFFELAHPGNGDGREAGYVGYLAANSFMKREFGRKLIEDFFATRVTLTEVIDTSGVYIPGHGTPTVILIGRNRAPGAHDRIFAIIGRHGEPAVPTDPARGHVWQSILHHIQQTGQTDEWTQSLYLYYKRLRSFPWNLADAEATELLSRISGARALGDYAARIGYFANTGSDDLFTAPLQAFRRLRAENHRALIGIITGSDVRDWVAAPGRQGFFPRSRDLRQVVDITKYPRHLRRLWPYRTVLGRRPNYTTRSYFDDNRPWYDWHQVAPGHDSHPWSITFAWVATHNHFALVRDRVACLPSAPVIKLHKGATQQDHAGLLGLLNSSAVCFWLKHHSNSKGRPTPDQTGTGEPWTEIYEFTARRLGELPLPASLPTERGGRLDLLAQELATATATAVIGKEPPTSERLTEAHQRWRAIRARMVAQQEELDWEVYRLYGLIPDGEELQAPATSVPPLAPGERAFEMVLARKAAAGQLRTTWFTRHNLTPITEPPEHWPVAYRDVVRRRIAAIEEHADLGILEQPEFKRRWSGETWEQAQAAALRTWLLDRCEVPELWYDNHSGVKLPRPLTIAQLAELLWEDAFVVQVANAYAPGSSVAEVLADIVADEQVPASAALRYRESGLRRRAAWEKVWRLQHEEDTACAMGDQSTAIAIRDSIPSPPRYTSADFLKISYWRQRGKYDVPNERFISYSQPRPGQNQPFLIGWAGWTPVEQADVLVGLIEEHMSDSDHDLTDLMPVLAGLHELLPWVLDERGDRDGDRTARTGPDHATRLDDYLQRLGITKKDLSAWHPPKPKRGRPRKVT